MNSLKKYIYQEDDYMQSGGLPDRYKKLGFSEVNQVKNAPQGDSHKKMVVAKKGDKYKLVKFGYRGMEDYTQHKDKDRRKNYLSRSGGIRNGSGQLTKDDVFSPNFWSRKNLWNAQTGGETNNLTIVENGEYVKDNQGKIGKITNIPSHDDNELIIDGESQYVPEGQGGQGTYNVNSVLSATHENRNQSDNTYGRTDEEIKIKPQEALTLAKQLNLIIKRPLGSISPSKLMDKLLESRDKLVSKYKNIDKPLNFERQANSFVANVDVLKSIPTPEDIYEFLFQNQENSKSENNEMYAQTGTVKKDATSIQNNNYYKIDNSISPYKKGYKIIQEEIDYNNRTNRMVNRAGYVSDALSFIPDPIAQGASYLLGLPSSLQSINKPKDEMDEFAGYAGLIPLPLASKKLKPFKSYNKAVNSINLYGTANDIIERQTGGASNNLAIGEDGEYIKDNEMYAQTGIQIDPSKRGTFSAQATRMGMSVQEAARKILDAPEGRYTPEMRKKANFARNFAKQTGGNTLYVDSKNDPRYKAYQDSLNLFNSYKNVRKGLEEKGYAPQMSYADKTKVMKFPVNRGLGKEYYDSFQNKENKNINQINENEYLILDTANDMVNTDLPYQLFNKKIKPSGVTEYKGSEKYMIGSTPDNIKISTKGRGLQLASSVFGGGRDVRPVFEYDNVNPKQQVIIKKPEIKKNYEKFYVPNKKPIQLTELIQRNKINNLNQIESIPYQQKDVNYQYPDINYQAPESTEFYNPERVIGSEYIRNADNSMGRFQQKKSEYYDKQLQKMNKQTGGLRKSQQDLKNWSDQKWRTNSGEKSSETGERYLPDAAWDNLSASEKARTNRAKREGGGTGRNVPQPKDIAEKTSNYRKAQYGLDDEMYYKSGGSTVNSAGNYTKPEMRKRLFNRIKGEASMGTAAGQWSARKAQKLAKAYKDNGGGYRQVGGQYIPVNTELPYNQYMETNIPMTGMDLADIRGVKTNREGQFENLSNREYKKISKSISDNTSTDLFNKQVGGNKANTFKNPLKKYVR